MSQKKMMITNLWQYLLSLEKGFAYSAQNKRIVLENGDVRHVDLEMYSRDTRSMVMIMLHSGKPKDGQRIKLQRLIDFYNKRECDAPAVGVIINTTAESWYATHIGMTDEQKSAMSDLLAFRDSSYYLGENLLLEEGDEND